MPTIPSAQPPTGPIERLIRPGRSRSRSAWTPNATTGPGPATPTPWWSGSSPPAPGRRRARRRLRHRHRGPAVPGGRLRRCSGSSPTRGWPASPGERGLEVEVATFETWDTARAEPSTRSSPARPGTGWTRSRERPRRRRCCGPAGGWRCSGTCSSPRPRWGRPSPRSTAGCCPTRRSSGPAGTGRPWTLYRGDVRQGGRRDAAGGRVRRAGAVAVRLGAPATPATSGWSRCPPSAASAGSRRTSWREVLAGIGAAIDAAGGGFTMRYTTVAVTAARAGAS